MILELATVHKIASVEYYMTHEVCLFKKTLTSFYILPVFTLYFGFVLTGKVFVLILNSTARIKMEIRSFFRDSSNFTVNVCKKYVESLPTLKNTSEEQQM